MSLKKHTTATPSSQTPREAVKVSYLIIGSGVSGLMLALKLAPYGKVLIVTKGHLADSNTYYAQGGIASVLSREDSFAEHIEDTLKAGAGLCHPEIVKLVVENGPRLIDELIALGVDFTRYNKDELHLTREGGHSQRRVVHALDMTGKAVMDALMTNVLGHENITIFEHTFAVDLITSDKQQPNFAENRCLGAYVLDEKSHHITTILSARTFLCTGGHGKVYQYTTNPPVATGDGIAMGARAGCPVANLEFMQFHPTCLYHPKGKSFLISEAVRGEGGILRDFKGQAFMAKYHPLADLAPRDIVARAIDRELKASGAPHAYLDVTHIDAKKVKELFPNIYSTCLQIGIDITSEMIPIVPAAHYSCGGLVVNEWGETRISRLSAIGEVACTGLHGANRLASNSLLEALVFADRAAARSHHEAEDIPDVKPPIWDDRNTIPADEQVVLSQAWSEIRSLMWHYVGIVRTEKRLKRAMSRLKALEEELDTYYWQYRISPPLLEVRNLIQVALLTVKCAMVRKESRGIHYTLDYPELAKDPKDTIIQ